MSGKFWTFWLLLVPVLGVATMAAGPLYGIWFPRDVSAHGHAIDHLFYFILWLTGIVFVGTQLTLVAFVWKYQAGKQQGVEYTHGSHHLEVVWTILPAAALVFIAIYQMNAWAMEKMDRPPGKPLAEITGRQFEWRVQYPGPDGELYTPDDIFDVNDLHVPVNEEVLLAVKSQDVLHSFFLPNFRVKQDVVPGMKQFVWFTPTETGKFDIVCAELCGWGHYKMKGQITVESRDEFDTWLARRFEQQQATHETSGDEES